MKFKVSIFFFIFFFVFMRVATSQPWDLKKETKDAKAYTATRENSPVKSFKVIATIDSPMDCVFLTATDYDQYTKMIKELSEFEILTKNDTSIVAYSSIEMPWPFYTRALIAMIKTDKTENSITVTSSATDNATIKQRNHIVRISDYYERYLIEKINDRQTKLTITGYVDIGGSVPSWIQNMFIVDGPLDFVDVIRKKCSR